VTGIEISTALDAVSCLRGRERQVEKLPGGLTNVNVKVTTAESTVVVRIPQPGSELLLIDRHNEHLNSVAAASTGVGAPVIEYVDDPGLLVVGFVEGTTFTDDDLREGAQLERVARACRTLHAGPRFVNEFDMFEVQRTYLGTVQQRGFRLPAGYTDFEDKVARVRAALDAKPSATVPCNNDLLAGNFIDDGTQLWLIDYEYSGNNDPCFELGNLWSEPDLSLEHLEALVEAYDGRLLRHRVARVRLWALMAKYGWTLWGSIQNSVSAIDYDFWSWAMEKYDRAVAEFEDPGFENLLEQVTRDD
jgi:thiamine kinase-like enzyme